MEVLLKNIQDVNVEEKRVCSIGKGYTVALRFATDFSNPLTQSAVMGQCSGVEAIAKFITIFLELHSLEWSQNYDSETDGPGDHQFHCDHQLTV